MEAHQASLVNDTATGVPCASGFSKTLTASFSLTCESKKLALAELLYEDRKFLFNKDLIIRVTKAEGGWVFESEDVPELTGFDTEYAEAEFAFRQTFTACWDRFAYADDSKLNRGAKNLKQSLLALVKSCGRT